MDTVAEIVTGLHQEDVGADVLQKNYGWVFKPDQLSSVVEKTKQLIDGEPNSDIKQEMIKNAAQFLCGLQQKHQIGEPAKQKIDEFHTFAKSVLGEHHETLLHWGKIRNNPPPDIFKKVIPQEVSKDAVNVNQQLDLFVRSGTNKATPDFLERIVADFNNHCASVMGAIDRREFHNLGWSKTTKETIAPNILQALKNSTTISEKVVKAVFKNAVGQNRSLNEALKAVEFFVQLATRLRQEGNFEGSQAVLSGLNTTAVYNLLSRVQDSNSAAKKAFGEIQQLNQLIKSNYKGYAEAYQKFESYLPFMGMYLTFLTKAQEGNVDMQELLGKDMGLNLNKAQLLEKHLDALTIPVESYPRSIARQTNFFVASSTPLTDAEADEALKQIAPKKP